MIFRKAHRAPIAYALLLSLGATLAAMGDSKYWIGGTSTWDNPTSWSQPGVPQSTDVAYINTLGAVVTYQNPSTPTGLLDTLFVEASVPGATLLMPGGQLTTSNTEVGFSFRGTFTQSGGTHTITGTGRLDLGLLTNASGTYNLSGNAALKVNEEIFIGQNGTGQFNQTGGSVTLGENGGDGVIQLAIGSGGGTYNLSAGTISATQLIIDCGNGNGLFKQTGGTATFTNSINIEASFGVGATATYELSGNGSLTDGTCLVGFGPNPSIFKQLGGTHTVNQRLYIANGAGGDYILSGGNLSTGETQVGIDAKGKFDQSGGTQTVTGALTIGSFNGSANQDVFNLSAGKLSSGSMLINPTGYVNQTGGTTQTGTLTMRGNSTIKLSGGTLAVTGLALEANKSKIDLTNRAMLIDYTGGTPSIDVRLAIKSGYNGGVWSGAGITSSTAAANPAGAVGYGEAKDVLGLSGTSTATWDGYTADATSILVRYTLGGDANLDGAVDFADLVKVAQNYGISTGLAIWTQGDFNYDGNVNFADLVKVAQNYGQAIAAPLPEFGPDFNADLAKAFSAANAPEPATPLLLLTALALTVFLPRPVLRCKGMGVRLLALS